MKDLEEINDAGFPDTPRFLEFLGFFGEARLGEIRQVGIKMPGRKPKVREYTRNVYLGDNVIGKLLYEPFERMHLVFDGQDPFSGNKVMLIYFVDEKERADPHKGIPFP